MPPLSSDPAEWLAELEVSDAPRTRENLAACLKFFAVRMPALSREDKFSFIKAIDLHDHVSEVFLAPPKIIAAFRHAEGDPRRLFYTKAGNSPRWLGIGPGDRVFRRFKVVRLTPALESRTCSVRDWKDKRGPIFEGGGRQWIVPDAKTSLEVI